jgi:hypothetical protein
MVTAAAGVGESAARSQGAKAEGDKRGGNGKFHENLP